MRSRSAVAFHGSLQTAIAAKPRLNFVHDDGDRLVAGPAVETFLNGGLERFVLMSPLTVATNQIPYVLAVVSVVASSDLRFDPFIMQFCERDGPSNRSH